MHTDIRTYSNNDGQVIPARRRSAKFAMRYGNHDRCGRSALCRRYVQQPSPDDCRIGAVQPKCPREDRFEVIGVSIVSARQADTSFRLGFPHDAAFVKRFPAARIVGTSTPNNSANSISVIRILSQPAGIDNRPCSSIAMISLFIGTAVY